MTCVTYRFHLQNADGVMVAPWDNVPHFPQISTHPDHMHTGEGTVTASQVRNMTDVLAIVERYLDAQVE